jgi:hypothetical protein
MTNAQALSNLEQAANNSPPQQLPGFIHIEQKKSGAYAIYCKNTFVKNGKVFHDREYLGKVIDRDKGIFFNRQRGYFTFNLVNGYGEPDPLDLTQNDIPQNVVLHFGDVWLVDQILKQIRLDEVLEGLIPNAASTIKSLVAFRLLDSNGYDAAEEWYRTSYARILYPGAIVTSSMTSKYIDKLGQEQVYNNFFNSYLTMLSKNKNISEKISIPILIDSTGLPNDIKTSLTAVNNHNGVVSNEIRLIYVVDKNTKLPIFFRYVPGNIIDNSTFITTLNSLIAYGINIALVIMDAGFSASDNLSQLVLLNIPFITRMCKNRKEHKELLSKYAQDLECGENAISFNGRSLYGKKVQISLYDRQLYAYIMLDSQQKVDEEKHIFDKYKDDPDRISKINKCLEIIGKFIIISSDDHDIKDILPLYYNRETIEQVFDISKNFADLIPLRAHKEETIRGRLLLSFIATIIYILVSQKLTDSKICTNKVFLHMRNLKIKLYESVRILEELTKIQKDVFSKLNLDCPYPEERGTLLKKNSFLANLKSEQNRGRGRPKGSKNKTNFNNKDKKLNHNHQEDRNNNINIPGKEKICHNDGKELKQRRGRPKGSKNKIKASEKETYRSYDDRAPRQRRGRPKGSKNKI